MKYPIYALFVFVFSLSFSENLLAQDNLSDEENAFLKSLSGKWSYLNKPSSDWGSHSSEITIRYIRNNELKISYPSAIFFGDFPIVNTKVLTAYYDRQSQTVAFNYSCYINGADWDKPMDVKVYIAIPFQNDIEDAMWVNMTEIYSPGGMRDEEVMFYKH